MTLDWDDLEASTSEAFNIWSSGSDLEWAKDACGRLLGARKRLPTESRLG